MTEADTLPDVARLGLLFIAAGFGFALLGATATAKLFSVLGVAILFIPLLVPLGAFLLFLVMLVSAATGGDPPWR